MNETTKLVLRYIEAVWNRGDLIALDELTAPEFTYRLGNQPSRDLAETRDFLATTRLAFPDWEVRPLQVISEGAQVVVRWQGEVTHLGPFHGLKATGRRITVCGINIYRVENGKVAEEFELMDSLGMMRQLGVFSA